VAAVVGLVACVHAAFWALNGGESTAPDVEGPLASVSYTRLQGSGDGGRVTAVQIRADLEVLAPHTQAIRTYGATGGLELVPAIADEFGLKVSVGAWIGGQWSTLCKSLSGATC